MIMVDLSYRRRDEWQTCFGVPMRTYVWIILFGVAMVLWGVSEILGFSFDFWALIAVLFGVAILYGAYEASQRGRRR